MTGEKVDRVEELRAKADLVERRGQTRMAGVLRAEAERIERAAKIGRKEKRQ